MNIQAFSQITKISAYTIRYYEKVGLIKHINRNASGHRCFTEKDIIWVEFVKRLKDTGMSLEDIRKYADLREEGEHTSALRMQLLEEHAIKIEERINVETTHLKKLREKITYYKKINIKGLT